MIKKNLTLAAFLHDVGAFYLNEGINNLRFDKEDDYHARVGYHLLMNSKPLSEIAPIVRYHHYDWSYGKGQTYNGEKVPLTAHVLHLADRIAVLIKSGADILNQRDKITRLIEMNSGNKFWPDAVEAFKRIQEKEYFWLNIISPKAIKGPLDAYNDIKRNYLGLEGLAELTKLFSQVIDFRSPFTATHSDGVAATATTLASSLGYSGNEILMMKIAGYLHDLGKLAVPVKILEKPGKLTREEYNIIKSHTYYTYQVLDNLKELAIIKTMGFLSP